MKPGAVISDCVLDRKPVALELLMRLEYLLLYRNGGESRCNSCLRAPRMGSVAVREG